MGPGRSRVVGADAGGPGDGASVPAGAPAVVLRLFASARQAAGTGRCEVRAATVADVLASATATYGDAFAAVLASSRVWVNGAPAGPATVLAAGDEVAVLPPVSGGAGPAPDTELRS